MADKDSLSGTLVPSLQTSPLFSIAAFTTLIESDMAPSSRLDTV